MKAIRCEMCFSTDMVKQDGMFVCQSCGTKYAPDEARKLMVELDGPVDVSGSTVKVDNSAFVQKYLANARRALEKEDWEEVEKYYNMVEQNDPNNLEAIFYSAYGKAKASLVVNEIYKREATFKVLANCISIIDDQFDPERSEENKEAILKIAHAISNMINSSFVYTETTNGYGITYDNKSETYGLFGSLVDGFRESIKNIQRNHRKTYLCEALITVYYGMMTVGVRGWTKLAKEWLEQEIKIRDEISQENREKYWSEHKEEKQALDTERAGLEKEKEGITLKITEIQTQRAKVPAIQGLIVIQKQIEELEAQKKSLGLFKFKDKRAVQEKIDALMPSKIGAQEKVAEEQRAFDTAHEEELSQLRQQLTANAERIKEIDETINADFD